MTAMWSGHGTVKPRKDISCGREHGQFATLGDFRVEGPLIQYLGFPLAGGNLLEPISAVGGKAPETVATATTNAVDGPVCPLMGSEGPAGGLVDLLLVTACDSGGKCFVGGRDDLADSLDGLFPGG